MTTSFLDTIKAGDQVIYNELGRASLETIDGLSPKRVRVNSAFFNKADGQEVGGGSFRSAFLTEATPEAVQAIADRKRSGELFTFIKREVADLQFVSLGALEQIAAILTADKAEREAASDARFAVLEGK